MSRTTLTELTNRVSAKMFWAVFVVVFVGFVLVSFVNQTELGQETRADRISEQLRCIECEGLAVTQSNTPTSKTIVRDVERRVNDGQSDAEIFAYYEGIYGEFIRLAPTTSSGNWIVYAVPAFGVFVFVIALWLSIRKSTPKKLLYGFWVVTALISVLGVVLFVNDARDSTVEPARSAQDARAQLESEAEENPTSTNLRNLALLQFDREEYVEAFKNFDAASEDDPQDLISRAYASNILLRAGEYELALSKAQEAVAIEPDSHVALYFRGLVFYLTPTSSDIYEQDFPERAQADFDLVRELAPDSIFTSEIDALLEAAR